MPTDPTQAAAQLSRLLLALPALEKDKAYPIADVAKRAGAGVETIARDLRMLVTRLGDEPGGFFERIQLLFDADRVQLESNVLFSRPMGLAPGELRAIELGLAILAREVAPEDAALVERARERVRLAAVAIPRPAPWKTSQDAAGQGDVPRQPDRVVSLEAMDAPPRHLAALHDAATRRRKARITYQSADAESASERTVHPYGLACTRGAWFLVAFCELRNGPRTFRVDRISTVSVLEDQEAPVPDAFSLDDVMKQGRALATEDCESLRVRYAPKIARFMVEAEAGTWDADGWFVVEYPLLDDRWAVRHVLKYGAEAEVLAPERIRHAVAERLRAALESS